MNLDLRLVNSHQGLCCSFDEKGKILEYCPDWSNKIHLTSKESNILDIIHNKHRDFFKDQVRACAKEKRAANFQLNVKVKSTEFRPMKVSLLFDEGRSLYTTLLTDISEEIEHQSLVKNLKSLNRLNIHLGYWEMNFRDGKFIFPNNVNDNVVERIDYQKGLKPDSNSELQTCLHLLKENKQSFDIRVELQENTENIRWLRILGKLNEQDESGQTATGFIEDISTEVQRENAFLNNNIELSSFEKGLDQFTIMARTDSWGKITYANQEFCRVSQYSLDELLGSDHRILNSGHHPQEFFREMWSCIKEGKNWRGKIKNKAKDGSYYWVDSIIIPINNDKGELVEMLSFRYEITMYEKLREENERLKKQITQLQKLASVK